MNAAGSRARTGTPRISASTVEPAERTQVFGRVDSRELRGADRLGPHEIGRLAEAVGDQGIVDSPVFQAVERVQPLQAEAR